MAIKSTDSQAEYLRKISNLIAEAKFAPDADLQFWIGLETEVLTKAHAATGPNPAAQQLAGSDVAMGAADMGAGAADMSMGSQLVGAGMAGGGGPAGLPGPGGPMPAPPGVKFSPDMMRRALRGGGIQGG